MENGAESENDAYVIRAEVDENADILKALYVSFIVTYGKCFVGAHRRRVKLEPKNIFADNKKIMETHVEVMQQRHEFIAHGGNRPLEQYETVVLLHPDMNSGLDPSMVTDTVHASSWGAENLKRCLSLTEFVRNQVAKILDRKSNSLYQDEVAPVPIDQWYARAEE